MNRYLKLAQGLQFRIPKQTTDILPIDSEAIQIPPKYEKLEQIPKDYKIQIPKKIKDTCSVVQLEAKRLRHHPKLDEILPEGIQKSQGRKLSKIQGLLNEILDSRQLARSLDIDTWIITRLTLSSNERICFVWWKLDSSIPETRHAEQNEKISNLLQSFRPAIQKGIIQNSLRFKESTSLKFIPRVEFKRDIELEKKIRLEEIYRKLDADTIKPLDAL